MYVCAELAPSDSYTPCKIWAVYETKDWTDSLAISKQEMVEIGGSIVGVLAVILAYTIIARAAKML